MTGRDWGFLIGGLYAGSAGTIAIWIWCKFIAFMQAERRREKLRDLAAAPPTIPESLRVIL